MKITSALLAIVIIGALGIGALVLATTATNNAHEVTTTAQLSEAQARRDYVRLAETNAELTRLLADANAELMRLLGGREGNGPSPWWIALVIIAGLAFGRWRVGQNRHEREVAELYARCAAADRRLSEGKRWQMATLEQDVYMEVERE